MPRVAAAEPGLGDCHVVCACDECTTGHRSRRHGTRILSDVEGHIRVNEAPGVPRCKHMDSIDGRSVIHNNLEGNTMSKLLAALIASLFASMAMAQASAPAATTATTKAEAKADKADAKAANSEAK